jgi:flagellar biosynthesis GTPase FlhF
MSEKRKRGIPLKANALALIDQKMNETGYENRDDLAEAAGLNTKTVNRIFQGHQPQRDTVKALAKALGILPTDLANQRDLYPTVSNSVRQKKNLGELDQNVCLAMLEPKRELASNLFTSGMGITFKLDDIQVPLGLIKRPEKFQHQKDVSPDKGSQVYREVKEKEKITPIEYKDFCQQVLANQKSPKNNGKHLTIIGEPGAGKTTQLLKIADWVLDETENLPIWISLGVVGEKPLQEYLLKDWLRDAAGKLDAAPPEWVEQLEQHLKDGRVWLLLDGADEMQVADPFGKTC